MYLQNVISSSIVVVYFIPIVLYFITGNSVHFKALFGMIGTVAISETIKNVFIGDQSGRPKGATDCDLLCTNGNQAGKPGMPSSHSATATFFAAFYFSQTNNPIIKLTLIIYALLVMLSRYLKKCHTVGQIIAGVALGLSINLIMVREVWCLKKN